MRDHASGTAILVALGILSLGQRRQELGGALVSEWERSLLHTTMSQIGGAPALLSSRIGLSLAAPVERLCVPGIITHFGVRKRLIELAVVRAISEGFKQLVVIGAGLDLLTLRISRATLGARCIELDHPATQTHKRQMLAHAGVDSRAVELIAADLASTSVTEALATGTRFDPALPTIFVVEGVTMYLSAHQVRALLADLRNAAPAARLLMTFMEPDPAGQVRFARQTMLLRGLLRLCGEPFMWGLHAEAMSDFLNAAGWRMRQVSGPSEFEACARAAGASMPKREFIGEYLVEALVGEVS